MFSEFRRGMGCSETSGMAGALSMHPAKPGTASFFKTCASRQSDLAGRFFAASFFMFKSNHAFFGMSGISRVF